jgi:hypothetical protein
METRSQARECEATGLEADLEEEWNERSRLHERRLHGQPESLKAFFDLFLLDDGTTNDDNLVLGVTESDFICCGWKSSWSLSSNKVVSSIPERRCNEFFLQKE